VLFPKSSRLNRIKGDGSKQFWNKKEQTEVFKNLSVEKENKQRCSKLFMDEEERTDGVPQTFRNKTEQTDVFQSFTGTKRNKLNYSNTFQNQSGTKLNVFLICQD
jgi:hypothetical protein